MRSYYSECKEIHLNIPDHLLPEVCSIHGLGTDYKVFTYLGCVSSVGNVPHLQRVHCTCVVALHLLGCNYSCRFRSIYLP